MPTITRLPFLRHLRAERNEYVLHFRGGRLKRSGAGLAYWFRPMSAAVSRVPVEDRHADILLNERSMDFQEVVAQLAITYRITDPGRAATRINFGINLLTGRWKKDPLGRVDTMLQERVQEPARRVIESRALKDLLVSGSDALRADVRTSLDSDGELEAMGLEVVAVQILQVVPSAEMEKALSVPAREELQEKADDALFRRRALAVESERAIRENEIQSEIELARRQEELIKQAGENRLEEVRQSTAAEREETDAQIARDALKAESFAHDRRTRASADADAERLIGEARAAAEAKHVGAWRDVPAGVLLGLAIKEIAGSVGDIQHLNITPDLLDSVLRRFLVEGAN